MSDLPPGWELARLGDLGCEVRGSVKPEPGTTYALYSVPTYPTGKPELLDGERIGSSKRPVEPGDVLLCKINPRINRVWSVGQRSEGLPQIASPEYLVFRTPDARLGSYLRWFLQGPAFRRWIELSVEGATGSHTRAKSGPILEQQVPVPPVAEQERIVAAIDEHLSRLGAANVALRSSGCRLEILQRRLVDAAVEGEPVRLGDMLREPLRNGLSARASQNGSIRVATLTAVTEAAFVEANTKLIEPPARSVDDLWMQPGDIYIQRSNTPELVGTAALFDGPPDWAIFPDLLIRVRVDLSRVEPAYLALALRSTGLRQYFQHSAQGIAGSMPKVSQPVVESASIPLPTLERQRELLRRVNGEADSTSRLSAAVNRAARRGASLRRSILASAFSGQLVPQDPEDEPAGVLLERTHGPGGCCPARRTRRVTTG